MDSLGYYLKALNILFAFFALNVYPSYLQYIYPDIRPSFSNFGGIGLIKNPTARLHEEGTLAISWTHDYPYLRGSIVAYPFDWLETSFQYTDINNQLYSASSEFSGSQSLKDKSFDAKIRLFKERNILPQISVGFRDLGGTGIFSSEYLVASKFINNIDYTIGLGWGNLSENPIGNPFSLLSDRFDSRIKQSIGEGGNFNVKSFFTGKPGIFAGVEYFLPKMNGARIKLELDGTDYSKEGPEVLPQASPINISFVYPFKDFHLKIGYIQGNKLTFGFSISPQLGKKSSGRKKTNYYQPIKNPEIVKRVTSRSDENLYKASLEYMRERGLYMQLANIDHEKKKYTIAYSENNFLSYPIAIGRTMRLMNEITPDSIEYLETINLNARIGIHKTTIHRDDLNRLENYQDTSLLLRSSKIEPYFHKEDEFKYRPGRNLPAFFYQLGPDLRSQIGGPDGFFFGDLRLQMDGELIPADRMSIIFKASAGITDNMNELKLPSDSVLPHVRTDIVQYLKQSRDIAIERLQFSYYANVFDDVYTKFSFGIFESMFAGYGGEVLYRPFYSDFAVGIEAWDVRQRGYDQLFDFRDYKTLTGHMTFYYREPNTNILFKLIGGKYLAKDSGFTFDFSKRFRSGLIMGAFFTLTDISREEFGEGSFDKGFFFWIPVQLFSSKYKKPMTGWGLRPITRDGGQQIIHGYHLYGVTDQANHYNLTRDWDDFYN